MTITEDKKSAVSFSEDTHDNEKEGRPGTKPSISLKKSKNLRDFLKYKKRKQKRASTKKDRLRRKAFLETAREKSKELIVMSSKEKKEAASMYLEQWENDRENWKFKKCLQNWLSDHVFDDTAVQKKHFEIFRSYLSGASSSARLVSDLEAQCSQVISNNGEAFANPDTAVMRAKKLQEQLTSTDSGEAG